MEPSLDELCRDEWTAPGPPRIRVRFRKDGSGYYDRQEEGGRLVHERLLFRLEGALKIKLARARGWVEVSAAVRAGPGREGDRFGQRELVLSTDPYAAAVEDKPGGELVLQSDAGAGLPAA